jgi:glutaredoxin
MTEVMIYSKPDCHLCDEVKEQLARLQQTFPFEVREVNILESPEHFQKFKEEIPVVFIDGRKAFKFRLDEKEFVRRLKDEGQRVKA